MTVHIFHADVHEYGLYPDCPRCLELADDPRDLDSRMSARLLRGDVRSVLDRIAALKLAEYERVLEAQWEERYDLPI
jgi:hypothetical protein